MYYHTKFHEYKENVYCSFFPLSIQENRSMGRKRERTIKKFNFSFFNIFTKKLSEWINLTKFSAHSHGFYAKQDGRADAKQDGRADVKHDAGAEASS